ncbi:MAG: PPC domain-containing protein, partial [Planctomycetales bacterium]|nr:PPC domain-containing protein [Planctomycetales bacterium]
PAETLPVIRFATCVVVCLLVIAAPLSGRAELPEIRFDRLKPLGAVAGTEIEVEIAGAEIDGVDRLLFDHAGIQAAPIPEKEKHFRVTIDANVPAGTYDVYLVGRFGVSNPRLFAVSKGLTDQQDNGQNRTIETAQVVSMNSAVNGTVDGNSEDFYRFAAAAGQRVVIDCQAQRLDSELDANMTLRSATGSLIASSSDYFGQDPLIDFVAPADGEYIVALHDLSYRGGYPYRLEITDQPRLENVFPPVIRAGEATELTAFGRNLGSLGGQPSTLSVDDRPLESMPLPVAAPSAELLNWGQYRFLNHPTHHSTAPTAATCTLLGMQAVPSGMGGVWDAQPLLVTNNPVTIESEANDTQETAQDVVLPLVVAGRFDKPRDADWYQFTVTEDGAHYFDVYCERIAGRADPYLVIVDDRGNRVTELDDFGHRINAFDGHLRDPSQSVNLSKDRQYRVLVQDRYQRGGARYQYVLAVRRAEPDFFAATIHRTNPNPGGANVFKGTATYLDVVIHQAGGYNGPVTLTAENLPPGMHFQPTTITNNTRGTFVLWADDDAPDATGFVRLIATGEVDGREFRREVRPYTRVWNNSGTSRPQRGLAVAIRERGPFDLRIEPESLEVEAGQEASLKLRLRRLWPEFEAKVTVQPLSFPGQFQLGNFDINPNQTEAELKIKVQPNTNPGRYTLSVLGQGQVPFNKDPAAEQRPNTLVSTPSRPVTLIVTAPKK